MAAISAGSRPRLRRGVRLVFDATRGTRVLLYPEGVLVPNETAAEVLARCDGVATVGAITAELAAQYDGVQADDVIALLTRLAERRFVEVADRAWPGRPATPAATARGGSRRRPAPAGSAATPRRARAALGASSARDPPALGASPAASTRRRLRRPLRRHETRRQRSGQRRAGRRGGPAMTSPPLGLLAELTYRCPLHCAYCSNPVNLTDYRDELDHRAVGRRVRRRRATWASCSSTCPAASRWPGATCSSWSPTRTGSGSTQPGHRGISLTDETARAARWQPGSTTSSSPCRTRIRSARTRSPASVRHDRKLAAARAVTALGLPLTVNVVLHRANLDRIAEIIDLAEAMGADRLELANTQYYGWACATARADAEPEQVDHAQAVAAEARRRLRRTR